MSANPADVVPVIPQWNLADRLRKIRRHVGMSQAEIAEKLETNQRTYASWESEKSEPRNLVAVAKRIEALSGVPAAWVLGVDTTSANQAGVFGQYHDESDGVVIAFPQVRAGSAARGSTVCERLLSSGEHRPAS